MMVVMALDSETTAMVSTASLFVKFLHEIFQLGWDHSTSIDPKIFCIKD